MNRRTLLAMLGLGVPALAEQKEPPQYPNGHCPVCGTLSEQGSCLSDSFDRAHIGISRPGCPSLESNERMLVTCAKCRNVYEMAKATG